jgi:hypothetical protein
MMMLMCVLLVLSKIFALAFFTFVMLILTICGKTLMSGFLGFFVGEKSGVGLYSAIVFWNLVGLDVIMSSSLTPFHSFCCRRTIRHSSRYPLMSLLVKVVVMHHRRRVRKWTTRY